MANLKELYCPVDFSEASLKAARYAVEMAKALGANVTLLHVYHLPGHEARMDAPRSVAQLSDDVRKAIDDDFRTLTAQLEPAGVKVKTALEVGTPYEKIVQVAEQARADLIVIGAMGQSRITRLLLGNVAERVVRTSKVPVLVVPE